MFFVSSRDNSPCSYCIERLIRISVNYAYKLSVDVDLEYEQEK